MKFDRIESHDGRRTLTAAEFMALPLADRIRFMLEQKPRFFVGAAEVPRHEALALR